jgi:hypothetical protein
VIFPFTHVKASKQCNPCTDINNTRRKTDMPEGPEVHYLGLVLRGLGMAAQTWGKHLYIYDQDWTFGLSGTVRLDGDGRLHKVSAGHVPGSVVAGTASFGKGVDFCTGTPDQFREVVHRVFACSKRALGPLLIDQAHIAGIGVAWGSEVLREAGLAPHVACNAQAVTDGRLVDALVRVRDRALATYSASGLPVAGWYRALYAVRDMTVYKTGTAMEVSGRTWWT